ncbi:MAG: hypothetical protein O2827_02640 [Verrucomicrobia bacterium]|nr:hypothetical protein [Verrucomicrobiota bacterium]
MKTKTLKLLGCALLSGLFAFVSQAQSVSSTPVGYVTQTINAGTGTGRVLTAFALPLYSPAVSGSVSSIASNVITSDGASFGDLAQAATPYSLKVVSGTLAGKYFPITANSATTVTVTGDLTGLAANDSYEVVEVDTLSSLFGSPSDGVIYGGAKDDADLIWVLSSTGTWSKYYHTGTSWVRDARGNPVSDNLAIQPDSGILIQRINANASEFVITGTVPSTQSVIGLNSVGLSVWANTFPVDITLSETNIQNANEFTANDIVYSLSATGTWDKYFHDGTNWRKQARGNPISDDSVISSGSAVLISKASTATTDSAVSTSLPYSL